MQKEIDVENYYKPIIKEIDVLEVNSETVAEGETVEVITKYFITSLDAFFDEVFNQIINMCLDVNERNSLNKYFID